MTTHNQLSARVYSQIYFSVVVHGRMQDLPRGANYYLGGGGFATHSVATRLLGGFGGMLSRKKKFYGCNLVRFGAYFHNFFTFKKSKNINFIQK